MCRRKETGIELAGRSCLSCIGVGKFMRQHPMLEAIKSMAKMRPKRALHRNEQGLIKRRRESATTTTRDINGALEHRERAHCDFVSHRVEVT